MVLVIAVEYNLEWWQLNYTTALLNADVEEKMIPRYEELDEKEVPVVVDF